MGQKPVLGKGLASLLPGAAAAVNPPPSLNNGAGAIAAGDPTTVQQQAIQGNHDRHPGISLAAVDEIVVNNYQPRRDFDDHALQELSDSIKTNGIIQPLVVRKTSQGYQLIAGERRLRAAKMAGLKHVPIVIRKSTDREALELALVENIQRQDLNCVDEALAYTQLIQDFSLTQEEVAVRVGKDRATIANHLRLLRLPEAIIDDLKRQTLTFGHGKALLGIEDTEMRLQIRKEIIERHLSVRETEILVDEAKKRLAASKENADDKDAHASATVSQIVSRLKSLAQELTRQFSAKVEIKGSERRGKIILHYASQQELERILALMQK